MSLPRRMFQIIQSGVGSGYRKNWLLPGGGGEWVGRRKVFRNPPDLMVLDPTGENDEL